MSFWSDTLIDFASISKTLLHDWFEFTIVIRNPRGTIVVRSIMCILYTYTLMRETTLTMQLNRLD